MTPKQIELVQTSFKSIAPRADEISEAFYNRLFMVAPQTRAMFADDMSSQREKLMQMIGFVVHRLHSVTEVTRPIENLGIRHAVYGAQPEHYPITCEALLWAMNEVAGDLLNEEIVAAWSEALTAMSNMMIDAAARAAAG